MFLEIINKILLSVFFLSCLNTIRHTYYFIQTWFTSTPEEPIKYRISNSALFILGLSVAFILTSIFTGIKI